MKYFNVLKEDNILTAQAKVVDTWKQLSYFEITTP
jgi:hypothetical protein